MMGAVGDTLGKLFRAPDSDVPVADLTDANTSYYYDEAAGTWVCKEDGKAPPPWGPVGAYMEGHVGACESGHGEHHAGAMHTGGPLV